MPVSSRDGDLARIFQRAIAFALVSTVGCGARTPIDLEAAAADEPAPEPIVTTPACVPAPVVDAFARATCSGEPSSSSYSYRCEARWTVPRPTGGETGAELSLEECGAVCGREPDWEPKCADFCETLEPYRCEVACDRITCILGGGGEAVASTNAGRRPPGFTSALSTQQHGVGGFFLACAELEAASVVAFRLLRHELASHGAPASLVERAARAAVEEERHAQEMTALARRFGAEAELAPLAQAPHAVRSLHAIALDNAVEGCVNETYAALIATWQAAHATDPDVRTTLKRIAVDETSHAAFSWSLHAWATSRLSLAERASLGRARAGAFARLRHAIETDAATTDPRAGLPTAREAACLLAALSDDAGVGEMLGVGERLLLAHDAERCARIAASAGSGASIQNMWPTPSIVTT